jgi:exodeoxyribonuclease VII large subunit
VARARIESFDLRRHVQARRLRLARLPGELRAALERGVARKQRMLATTQMRLAGFDLRARTGALRRKSEQRSAELGHRVERYLALQRRRLEGVAIQLSERSPFQILERGYAIAYDEEGRLLRSVEQVRAGEPIRVRVSDGNVNATVKDKERLKE